MAIITNHLDNPMTILGVKISIISMIVGSLIFGAVFDNFYIGLGILGMFTLLKKRIKKYPKFSLVRFLYKNFPTKSSIWAKSLESMIESHKKDFCK